MLRGAVFGVLVVAHGLKGLPKDSSQCTDLVPYSEQPLGPTGSSITGSPQFIVENHLQLRQEDDTKIFIWRGSVKIELRPIDLNEDDYNENAKNLDSSTLEGPGLLELSASKLSYDDARFIQDELRQPISKLSRSLLDYLITTSVDQWYAKYISSPDSVKRFIEDHSEGKYHIDSQSELKLALIAFLNSGNQDLRAPVFYLSSGINRLTETEIDNIVSASYTGVQRKFQHTGEKL